MFIFKLLFMLLLLQPTSSAWQRVETESHISFLFPNTPQKLTQQTDGIRSKIYQTKDLTCVFGVVCSDFSNSKIEINDETVLPLYEQLKKGSLSVETAILKDEKTVPYENMLIKEIEYSIIKDNYEMTYFKRFIFRENMVYQISIGGKTRHREYIEKGREIFFNSIIFDSPETNKN